jgi:hypothetical protein
MTLMLSYHPSRRIVVVVKTGDGVYDRDLDRPRELHGVLDCIAVPLGELVTILYPEIWYQ